MTKEQFTRCILKRRDADVSVGVEELEIEEQIKQFELKQEFERMRGDFHDELYWKN